MRSIKKRTLFGNLAFPIITLLMLTLIAVAPSHSFPVATSMVLKQHPSKLDVSKNLLSTTTTKNNYFVIKNSLQNVQAEINTQKVSFISTTHDDRFSLAISNWGRENNLQLTRSTKVYKDGNNVIREHINGFSEKFSNSSEGIRHDFIIESKPVGTSPIRITLNIEGAKLREKSTDGVVLALDKSNRELTYDRLYVTDATGKSFSASMRQINSTQLAILVDDSNATYPLTIDPTISDPKWSALDSGIIGTVYAIKSDLNGNIYIGGEFSLAGSIQANNIAKWDGKKWAALDIGTNGAVYALTIDKDGILYVGGSFTMAGGVVANHIAKWDDNNWFALNTGIDGNVNALASDINGFIYAGGKFNNADGTAAKNIAKWNGVAWSAFGEGLGTGSNAVVFAMAVDSAGNLYAGGKFASSGSGASLVVNNNVAKWNQTTGSWVPLGNGVSNGDINSMAIDNSYLYVGGFFTAASGAPNTQKIARWNGITWSSLGNGFVAEEDGIVSLTVDGKGNLYAGGRFVNIDNLSANNVAKWNGVRWLPIESTIDDTVWSMHYTNKTFYVGGAFTRVTNDLNTSGVSKFAPPTYEAASGQALESIKLKGCSTNPRVVNFEFDYLAPQFDIKLAPAYVNDSDAIVLSGATSTTKKAIIPKLNEDAKALLIARLSKWSGCTINSVRAEKTSLTFNKQKNQVKLAAKITVDASVMVKGKLKSVKGQYTLSNYSLPWGPVN